MNRLPPFARGRTKRLSERAPVQLDATVVTISAYQYPELVDISQTGARLKGESLPPKGASALLRAGALDVFCRVVWVQGDQCGIRFEETVPLGVLEAIRVERGVRLEPTPVAHARGLAAAL